MENTYEEIENTEEENNGLINDWNIITNEELDMEIEEINKVYEKLIAKENEFYQIEKIRSTPELISPPPILTPTPPPIPTPEIILKPIPISVVSTNQEILNEPIEEELDQIPIISNNESISDNSYYSNRELKSDDNILRKRVNKLVEIPKLNAELSLEKEKNKIVKSNYLTRLSFFGIVFAVNFMIYYIYYSKINNYKLLTYGETSFIKNY